MEHLDGENIIIPTLKNAYSDNTIKTFPSGIHAFWKGQGDRDQIRTTQANIMKQYMDAEADPCHDFYQYACGNWPALNPIPADKAGFVSDNLLNSSELNLFSLIHIISWNNFTQHVC